MKSLIFLAIGLFLSTHIWAQDKSIITATLSVKGNCEECKKHIENAADLKGVKYSSWDEKRQMLTVTYRADKVALAEIENAIAAGGYDTEHVPASSTAYGKLPVCCRCRDKKCDADKK